jgi:hypothetical protein
VVLGQILIDWHVLGISKNLSVDRQLVSVKGSQNERQRDGIRLGEELGLDGGGDIEQRVSHAEEHAFRHY